jgi:hypothetical protein
VSALTETPFDTLDVFSLIDTPVVVCTLLLNFPNDGLSFSDALVATPGLIIIAGDSTDEITLSDAIQLQLNYLIPFSDTITLTDSLGLGGVPITVSIVDVISLSDSVILVLGINQSLNETLTISDTLSSASPYTVAETDTITLSDSIIVASSFIDVTETDTISLTDSATVVLQNLFTLSDSVSLSDTSGVFEFGLLKFSDSLAFTDFANLSSPITGPSVVDALLLTELVTVRLGLNYNLIDSITLSDLIATFEQPTSFAFVDTYTLSDSAQLALMHLVPVSVSDSLILTDTLAPVTPISSFIDYLRRYLNDWPNTISN